MKVKSGILLVVVLLTSMIYIHDVQAESVTTDVYLESEEQNILSNVNLEGSIYYKNPFRFEWDHSNLEEIPLTNTKIGVYRVCEYIDWDTGGVTRYENTEMASTTLGENGHFSLHCSEFNNVCVSTLLNEISCYGRC